MAVLLCILKHHGGDKERRDDQQVAADATDSEVDSAACPEGENRGPHDRQVEHQQVLRVDVRHVSERVDLGVEEEVVQIVNGETESLHNTSKRLWGLAAPVDQNGRSSSTDGCGTACGAAALSGSGSHVSVTATPLPDLATFISMFIHS